MAVLTLRRGAWSDRPPVSLDLPHSWSVRVLEGSPPAPISPSAIGERIDAAIGSPRLADVARGRTRAVVAIDDLTRPTPTDELLPPVLERLESAGISSDRVTILIAGGTHALPSHEEIKAKVGPDLAGRVRIVAHDMGGSRLRSLGATARGIPIDVNEVLLDADLRVGVGGVYPHPAAGFSGGSKIIAPGLCGLDTARKLHDLRPAGRGVIENEFRREVDAVAGRIGLDFVVNAVVDHERRLVGVFAGDRVAAHRTAAREARQWFRVAPDRSAQIVIADAYPFDTHLDFARDRALWPLETARGGTVRVAVASCSMGTGEHALRRGIGKGIVQRLRTFGPAELARIGVRVGNLRRQLRSRRLEMIFLADGLTDEELRRDHPRATLVRNEDELMAAIGARLRTPAPRVAVYRGAPLLVIR